MFSYFCLLFRRCWWGDAQRSFRFCFFTCLFLEVAWSLCGVAVSYGNKGLMEALHQRDPQAFVGSLFLYLFLFAWMVPAESLAAAMRSRLALKARWVLSQHFLPSYFTSASKGSKKEGMEHMDARVELDLKEIPSQAVILAALTGSSFVTVLGYLGVMWTISKVLLVVLAGYVGCASYGMLRLGKRLQLLYHEDLKLEAGWRTALLRGKERAESIAFLSQEKWELEMLNEQLRKTVKNFKVVIGVQCQADLFRRGYFALVAVIPFAVLAPGYFSGEYSYGTLIQASGSFACCLFATSVVVTNLENWSHLGTALKRVQALEHSLGEDPSQDSLKRSFLRGNQEVLELHFQRFLLPQSSRVLLNEVHCVVREKEHLLITGESGVGKTSLLRAIKGLWSQGVGEVKLHAHKKMLYLPQELDMPDGALEDWLYFGVEKKEPQKRLLAEGMKRLGIEDLAHQLKEQVRWSERLSPGEKQRVALLRLLLQKADVALVDECTSWLDEKSEQAFYELLLEKVPTVISIGRKERLARFHLKELHVKESGSVQRALGEPRAAL